MVRKRRLKYVGHVLRKDPGFLARQVLVIKIRNELRDGRSESSILMDIPDFNSVEEVIEMASDKGCWQIVANSLQMKSRINNDLILIQDNSSEPNRTHSYNLRPRQCRK